MKLFKLLLGLAIFPLVLSSCTNSLNSEEKQLVGTWYLAATEEMEEDEMSGIVSIEGTTQYLKDKTSKSAGKMTLLMEIGDDYYGNYAIVNLTYTFNMSGSWEIENGYITEYVENIDIKLSKVSSTGTDNENELNKIMEEYALASIPELKSELLGEQKSKISKFSQNEITIIDEEEGKEMTYKRISK